MGEVTDKYIKDLEKMIRKFMAPVKDAPFKVVIQILSGHKVLAFDKKTPANKKLLDKFSLALHKAGSQAYKIGIYTARPNEAGNEMEPYVKKALLAEGLKAEIPLTKKGTRKGTGYPDLEITDKGMKTTYLECKTYNIKNIDSSQRTFYFSPSENFKITKDAFHFMVSYQLEKETRGEKTAFVPKHWKLYSLENLTVDLKHEFNQCNKKLYGSSSDPNSLLAESDIQR